MSLADLLRSPDEWRKTAQPEPLRSILARMGLRRPLLTDRSEHVQPGGQRVATARLSDGRVLRVCGGRPGDPVGSAMLLWLRFERIA